jgi:transposase
VNPRRTVCGRLPQRWFIQTDLARGHLQQRDQLLAVGAQLVGIEMTVRGLGCPVRFALTVQKGDAPKAAALFEGLPAEVIMADTAYDADHLRQTIATKGALAVIPNNPSRALKYPLDKHLYTSAISWNAASQNSSNSAASQPASKRPPEITWPSSLSRPP